jgi:hypothetical protein
MARTTKKAETEQVDFVKAKIEKRHYSSTGNRLSPPPQTNTFTPDEWLQFQQAGPSLGWFVVEVIAAPDGLDTSYKNPS